jgi:hypothetical protein
MFRKFTMNKVLITIKPSGQTLLWRRTWRWSSTDGTDFVQPDP